MTKHGYASAANVASQLITNAFQATSNKKIRQDELYEKFGLEFDLFNRDVDQASRTGNAFQENERLIARLDQLARNEDFQEKLENVEWDLVVVDEAHKMSASYFGNKLHETKRYKLGKLLGQTSRHFLLTTATPHNGKEEDFQLFMRLLDEDRFYGKFREGAHQGDVTDLMRRMVKEDLVRFDGTPLFPERYSYPGLCMKRLTRAISDIFARVLRIILSILGSDWAWH